MNGLPQMTAADEVRETQIGHLFAKLLQAENKEAANAAFDVLVLLMRSRSDEQLLRMEIERRSTPA
jgi:hypothetical protein